jgi:hypothetical protein
VISCRFALPADALETSGRGTDNEVVWRLALSAEVPGVDYASSFEVPVFRTAESDAPRTPEEATEREAEEDLSSYRQPADSRIRVTVSRRGLDVFFAPARNPGAAAAITVFFLAWTGITVAIVLFGAPLLFPVIFGGVNLLLLYPVISLWLGTSSVHCDREGVRITAGLLGSGTPRLVAAGDFSDVTLQVGMQSGSSVFYDLQVVTKNGERISAGKALRDKREAEWLASQMKGAVAGNL